ncbi:hypothetical protein pb186bvf_005728 [Paramecium bursaria]
MQIKSSKLVLKKPLKSKPQALPIQRIRDSSSEPQIEKKIVQAPIVKIEATESGEEGNILPIEKVAKGSIEPEDLLLQGKTGKTQAEIQFNLVRYKRLGQKIQNKMEKTYRQKIETFNKNIQKMPEHYDIPKVGPG